MPTPTVPTTGTVWPTNWELSAARATAALRELHESYGLAAPRLSAVGHADTRPRATNDTAQGRAQNRRTQIVVLVAADNAVVSDVPLVDDITDADGVFPGAPGPLDGVARDVGEDETTDAVGIGESGDPDIVEFDNPVFSGP